jgi:pyruvate kinase
VHLVVEACGPAHAETRVLVGGTLSDGKGVSIVGMVLPLCALTEKDRRDLEFGLAWAPTGSRFPSCSGRRM